MTETRPSWLTEPCPPWCARQHLEDEHDEDRYHQSEPTILPAVAGDGDAVPVTDSLAPVELAIRLGRHVGDQLDWVVIEELDACRPRLVLTAESADRLVDLLGRHLSRRRLEDD